MPITSPPRGWLDVVFTPINDTPAGTGADTYEWTVPYDPSDGITPVTWAVRRMNFRVAVAGGAPAVKLEKSSAAGAFSATDLGTITLPTDTNQAAIFSGFTTATLVSGDKVRQNFVTLATATGWVVQLELQRV